LGSERRSRDFFRLLLLERKMKKKLIAVDDDPVILELILNSFSSEKYEIITTSSAEEAISTYLEQPTSVILTDLKMPGMTGEMFVKRIFELGHHPIFIILTSVTDARIVVELFKIGVYDYILKPFIPGELENKVDRAFQYSDMKALEESVQNERKIRIEHQLNWNLFKENIIRRDNDKIDSSLMTSINTNLVQGAGLGTLVSLGTMIEQEMKLQRGSIFGSKRSPGYAHRKLRSYQKINYYHSGDRTRDLPDSRKEKYITYRNSTIDRIRGQGK
jgi:FixJ family two-component response regulator